MIWSDTCIRRPVMATMLTLALIVFGVIGYSRLPVREFPDVDPPVVSVVTVYPGANPEVVETEVTEVLEEELNTIEGIRTLASTSREEVSAITIEFELRRDVDVAAQDVRDKISRVRGRLPDDVDPPIIAKQDADARPIMWIALFSNTYSPLELTDLAENQFKDRLQNIPGVGRVIIGGSQRYAVRVRLDADKLAARRLTVGDVTDALRRENVEIPSGRIEGKAREFSIRTEGEFRSPEEFNDLVIAYREGAPVRLRDVGRAETGVENERTLARFNSQTSVGLGVVKQSKANIIEVADGAHRVVAEIRETLPPDLNIRVAYDASIFVRRSIREVQETLFIAGTLVTLVIFLFLRSVRTTLIPALAIPASIIGAFLVIYLLGFTINNLTLLALVLAIGLVVDDAIVVVENAFRHIEHLGEPPLVAARQATGEIAFAVISTTLSLVAVFVPVAFLGGATGRLLYELGITMAVAVIISSFVALTLTPVLCSRFLGKQTAHVRIYYVLERFFNALSNRYRRALEFALRHRAAVVVAGLVSLGAIGWMFVLLPKEFLPTEDKGAFLVITKAPEGATLDYTDTYQQQVEQVIRRIPEIRTYFSAIGLAREGVGQPDAGILFARLVEWSARDRTQSEVVQAVFPQLMAIPGVLAFAIEPEPIDVGGRWNQKLQFVLQSGDLEQLNAYSEQVLARLRQEPFLTNPDSDLKLNKPELRVTIDRDKASDLGVSVREIAESLQVLFGGQDTTTFKRKGDQYDVIVQLDRMNRFVPRDLENIYIRTQDRRDDDDATMPLVQLSNLVTVAPTVGPREINHYNRMRSATLTAGMAPGTTLDQALNRVQQIADEVLPPTFSTALRGQAREFREGQSNLVLMFGLAVLLVYMVLAAQFESFIDPFVILLAVPLAVVGAMLTLWLARMSLNLFSVIGMIMLVGLVTKNSILLVEFANQLRRRGKSIIEATTEAGAVRLRPVLMTAISTIFGVMPIALALGAGSQSRRPLGLAVVGGMAFSTMLTLFVVPVAHTMLMEAAAKLRGSAPPTPAGDTDKPASSPPLTK